MATACGKLDDVKSLFVKKPDIILRLLRIPLDFAAVVCAFLLAYGWRIRTDLIPFVDLPDPTLLPLSEYLWFCGQAGVLVILIFAWERMYSLNKSYRFRKEMRRMVLLIGAAFTVIILYFFLVGITFFSRFILGVAFVMTIALMLLHRLVLRIIQHWLWKKGISRRRVLFLGDGKVMRELVKIWNTALGFEIVGGLGITSEDSGVRSLGEIEDLEKIVKRYEIDEVVQTAALKNAAEVVEYCQLNHVEYRFVPNMLEVQRTNTEIDFVHEIPVITLRSSAIDGWARVIKRATDILVSGVGLVVLSPVFLIVGLAIKWEDRGPIFYQSKRVSRNTTFWMWKFRSMGVDADKKKAELLRENRRSGPLFKIENDPRVTRVGRFLRKTTIDELPQLLNVLKGDLSLVGPRAHLPEEVEQYEKHHRKVLAVKAGATGLAQVSGRSKLDFEQEVKLDVYYIENWSFWLDMKIVLRTFGVLLDGE